MQNEHRQTRSGSAMGILVLATLAELAFIALVTLAAFWHHAK